MANYRKASGIQDDIYAVASVVATASRCQVNLTELTPAPAETYQTSEPNVQVIGEQPQLLSLALG
jgi:hypothetical protein